jgi:hypothetical protein
MQKILLPLLLLLFSVKVFAQEPPEVEARIKLIENLNSEGKRELSVGLTVINNLKKDIYIPGFSFVAVDAFEIYEIADTVIKKVNLFPGRYSGVDTINGNPVFTVRAKKWSELDVSFHDWMAIKNNFQDSLIKGYQLDKWLVDYHNEPLFLKAREAWEDYAVQNISIILSKKATYKIVFEPKKFEKSKFPKKIGSYQVVFPDELNSNTVYYYNLSPEKQDDY